MRYIWLVALREYMENAKTKGFWIGLFVFPLIIFVSMSAPEFLERSKPKRYFVVADPSGEMLPIIDEAMERLYRDDLAKEILSGMRELSPDAQSKLNKKFNPGFSQSKIEETLKNQDVETLLEFFRKQVRDNPQFASQLVEALKEVDPEFEEPEPRYERVELPDELARLSLTELQDRLRPYLRGDEVFSSGEQSVALFAAILVPAQFEEDIARPQSVSAGPLQNPTDEGGIEYWSTNLADTELVSTTKRRINEEIRRREYSRLNLDSAEIERVEKTYLPYRSYNPKKKEGEEKVGLRDQIKQYAPIGFVYLLWIAIFTISQMLLNNTIEEKSNRIIEVLLSSVTSSELMYGKLFGIAAIGLTMIGTWILSLVGILALRAGPEAKLAKEVFDILKTSGLLPAFAIYFVLGYLTYAGIFLSIGSLCSTLKDAQNLMAPVMVIMIVPLITMMFIPKDPNGTLATVLSWIPPYTPFLMMNRAAADPPLRDLVGTTIMLVIFAAGVLYLSGKIFRVAVLRTGQPPRIVELYRMIRRQS